MKGGEGGEGGEGGGDGGGGAGVKVVLKGLFFGFFRIWKGEI